MEDKIKSETIAKMIDHSLLHPTLTEKQMVEGCKIAKKYDVASVCVKPCHVSLAKNELENSDVKICAVIGFPHGNSTIAIKVAETEQVINDGATEVDMVINIAKVIEQDWSFLENEIGTITSICHKNNAIVKVIFETDYLEESHIVRLCSICSKVGADFVKTSTGYNYIKTDDGKFDYKGATLQVIELMRKHAAPEVQVKAAGRVVGLEGFLEVLKLGATRVGTGQTVSVMEDARSYFKSY
jgi:deoxyribose-phosphate aldolase